MRGNKGFTLIEIIVAVALVAILSAAIAPSVLNNISQGRVARAQSDVQTLGAGIARFKSDVGVYPRLVKGSVPDTTGQRIDYLASFGGEFPTKTSNAKWFDAQTAFTKEVVTKGSVEDFNSHIIMGKTRAAADSLYPRAADPDNPNLIGFRGGVISADPSDPWGNKYVANVAALGFPGQAVWVISAGPNGLLETSVSDSGFFAADTVFSDDIGFRVQ